MNIIERVKKLNFPFGEYVIIGGGVLDALGIRATNDVDAAVTQKLFKELRATGEWEEEAKHGKIFLKRSNLFYVVWIFLWQMKKRDKMPTESQPPHVAVMRRTGTFD